MLENPGTEWAGYYQIIHLLMLIAEHDGLILDTDKSYEWYLEKNADDRRGKMNIAVLTAGGIGSRTHQDLPETVFDG